MGMGLIFFAHFLLSFGLGPFLAFGPAHLSFFPLHTSFLLPLIIN